MSNVERYFSQIVMPEIGLMGQQKIQAAKIIVVGAGGLGCPVITYLAGMGIGCIGIVDDDIVTLQNLHRQVLYNETEIGQYKTAVAKQKLLQHNRTIIVNTYTERLTEKNAIEIISKYDIVIDCSDNVATRYIIDAVTKKLKKPFVYGAVKQLEGQVSVFNYNNGPSYRNLFPDETIFAFENDCTASGIVGFVTGAIGCMQVNEAMKIILENGNVLSGEVMCADFKSMRFRNLKIKGS